MRLAALLGGLLGYLRFLVGGDYAVDLDSPGGGLEVVAPGPVIGLPGVDAASPGDADLGTFAGYFSLSSLAVTFWLPEGVVPAKPVFTYPVPYLPFSEP